MARPLRVEFPGAIYHVTVRRLGSWEKERAPLFEDDQDRERFLSRLAERVEQFRVRMYLFCLMENHFHLVLETPEANLGRFMQSLTTAYTVYFNLRHRRHGHLVDGRYKAKVVEGDEYLLALSRYVHLNPVMIAKMEDKLIKEKARLLREYKWSTYPSYIGKAKPFDFVEYGPTLAQMNCKKGQEKTRYREYVETGLAENDEEFEEVRKQSPYIIGDAGFRAWVEGIYQQLAEKKPRKEDVSYRVTTVPLSADVVMGILGEVFEVEIDEFRRRRRNSWLRAIAARFLCRHCGLTQREVAGILDVGSGSAISQHVRKLSEWLPNDRRLRRLLNEAEMRIDNLRNTNR